MPPYHITGNRMVDWTIFLLSFVLGLYGLKALRLARQGRMVLAENLTKSGIVFVVSQYFYRVVLPAERVVLPNWLY